MIAPLLARGHRQLARWALAASAAGVLLVAAAPAGHAGPTSAVRVPARPHQFADDGLAVDGVSTYDVLPVQGVIRATVEITLTHQLPDRSVPGGTEFFYWDEIGVPILSDATNLVATSGGAPLTVTREATEIDLFEFAVITLPRRLRYPQTQQLRITYDLTHQPPGAASPIRVSQAYASVIPIAFGDPGSTDVHVRVPNSYQVEYSGQFDRIAVTGGLGEAATTYSAEDVDPAAYDLVFSVYDTRRLISRQAEGDHDVTVRAWPEDPAWADLVLEQVHEGLPALEELLGIPWPVEDRLFVDESVSPFIYGYAGWFDDASSTVEITDGADAAIVLHELSHAWFGSELSTARFITEGLAEEFAARTLEATSGELPAPEPIDTDDPARVELAGWHVPSLSSPDSAAYEAYGYNASFALMRSLSEEIGIDALARVVQAEFNDEIAYQGDPEPEEWSFTGDWKRFLDLLEEVGGSERAEELFRAHVVLPTHLTALDDRAEARAALAELDEAGAGWTSPLIVRTTMGHWRFDGAQDHIAASHGVLAERDELAELLEPIDLAVPAGFEDAYERAGEIGELEALGDDLLELGPELVEAHEEVRGSHDPLTWIGLLGSDAGEQFDDALAAFDDADVDATRAAIDDATATVAAAQGQGLLRVGGAVVAIGVIAGGVILGRRLLRRRQERRAAGADAVADLEGLGEAEGLQLADVDLEAGAVAAQGLGEDGGDHPGTLGDRGEGGPGPGAVGGGGVEAVEPLGEGGDVVD